MERVSSVDILARRLLPPAGKALLKLNERELLQRLWLISCADPMPSCRALALEASKELQYFKGRN
jgi:hypothetical protein